MTVPSGHLRRLREQRDSRRLGVAKVLRETPNATDIEVAKVFGVDRHTIGEDRKFLMQQVNNEALTEMQQWQAEHIEELQVLRKQLEDPAIKPADKVALALAIVREDRKVKGYTINKSVSANFNADAEPIGPYRKFVQAVRGLDEAQIEQLFLMARNIPRKGFTMVEPPKTSPLWTRNQLTESTDANS